MQDRHTIRQHRKSLAWAAITAAAAPTTIRSGNNIMPFAHTHYCVPEAIKAWLVPQGKELMCYAHPASIAEMRLLRSNSRNFPQSREAPPLVDNADGSVTFYTTRQYALRVRPMPAALQGYVYSAGVFYVAG